MPLKKVERLRKKKHIMHISNNQWREGISVHVEYMMNHGLIVPKNNFGASSEYCYHYLQSHKKGQQDKRKFTVTNSSIITTTIKKLKIYH